MAGETLTAQIDGVTQSWREAGSGDDVAVLIHGFPFSSAIWWPQLESPVPGWRFIAPDMRGFGGSGPLPGQRMSMDAYADDVAALLRHLGILNAVVCGHSMGGYITFGMMRRAPSMVRALVFCDTRAEPDSAEGRAGRLKNAKHVHAHGTAALVDSMVPRLVYTSTGTTAPEVANELRAVMSAAPASAVVCALLGMADRPDSSPLLRSIDVPTQVIVGEHDQITPPGDARLLARAIRGSHIEMIPNAGHMPNLEQPDEFNRVLASFLHGISD